MSDNSNINLAKINKEDEFYTRYENIEKEISVYIGYDKDIFDNKIIFLPCDDYEYSNFTKYFLNNFERFNLKRLISTCYNDCGNGKYFIKTRDNQFKGYLRGNGDFRSEEIISFRNKSDFIITNPPFSLFRDFISWITESGKKFLVIGNINAISCKDIFPLFKDNKIWLGNSYGSMIFNVPNDYGLRASCCGFDENGRKFIKLGNICWITNIDYQKRHRRLKTNTMSYNLKHDNKLINKLKGYGFSEYPHYDNYDAIEVPFVKSIPSDYDGVMGVPISFLEKYNPEQFEIVGTVSSPSDPDTMNLGIDYSKYIGHTQDGKLNGRTGSTFGKVPVIRMDDGKHPYYEKDGVRVQTVYHRIFIRNKKK